MKRPGRFLILLFFVPATLLGESKELKDYCTSFENQEYILLKDIYAQMPSGEDLIKARKKEGELNRFIWIAANQPGSLTDSEIARKNRPNPYLIRIVANGTRVVVKKMEKSSRGQLRVHLAQLDPDPALLINAIKESPRINLQLRPFGKKQPRQKYYNAFF